MSKPLQAQSPSALQRDDGFAAAVLHGLLQPQKSLPCRFLYDARGSALFEQITELPEYYPTRAETAILTRHASEIADGIGCDGALVELGSGSSRKTELLLAALPELRGYIPIDISVAALSAASARLRERFPRLDVRPVVGNFANPPLAIPTDLDGLPRFGFFPGSTIGNLTHDEAVQLLGRLREHRGVGSRLIVGVDLDKDAERLIAAYDDAAGITAAFNLNLLARINREIEPAFDLARFGHEARHVPTLQRIEMHLVSTQAQKVRLLGHTIAFRAGETIHTENSHKYTPEGFRALAHRAGWTPSRLWRDDDQLFSMHELVC